MDQDHPSSDSTAVAARLKAAGELYDARVAKLAAGEKRGRQAQSPSTRDRYMRDLLLFLDMCVRRELRPVPASGATLRVLTIELMERPVERGKNKGRVGRAPASIRRAWSAVRTYHQLMGENLPDLSLAGELLEEYEELRAADPTLSDGKSAPALRLPTLDAMFQALPEESNAGLRDRALLSLGWAMMATRLVLSELDIDHLVEVDGGLDVQVWRNPITGRLLDEPRIVAIPCKPDLGAMDPVLNALAWKTRLAVLGIVSGPYLRSVDKGDNVNGTGKHGGPRSVGFRMDPPTVELVVARAARLAALPGGGELTSQSLRRGGIEDAYEGGADSFTISRHAGYSDRSTMVFRWISNVDQVRNALAGITYRQP